MEHRLNASEYIHSDVDTVKSFDLQFPCDGKSSVCAIFEGKHLFICFPGREFVLTDKECELNPKRGYTYPFPFLSVIFEENGVSRCCTLFGESLDFISCFFNKSIDKTTNIEHVEVGFNYPHYKNTPIEIKLVVEPGDFHASIERYKAIYASTYGVHDNNLFKGCFHLKRTFYNNKFCSHAVKCGETIDLEKVLEIDRREFGGIDAGLLFDVGYDYDNDVRCGNDNPVFMSDSQTIQLNNQIRQSQIPWFGYFDPYIIKFGSQWDKKYPRTMAVTTPSQEVMLNWGADYWHPCLESDIYKEDNATYIRTMLEKLDFSGMYIDEFGNGTQYHCYNPAHFHKDSCNQIEIEKNYLNYMQEKIPDKLWMCEFPPVAEMADKFNIVLCDTRSLVNIYRFIFPWLKYVRIIGCDYPLGDNEWDLNISFFNGEALWLDNDPMDEKWYPEKIKDTIRKQYNILKKYSDVIDSLDVEPLYKIESENILCNRFTKDDTTIFMLINPTDRSDVAYFDGLSSFNCEVVYGDKTSCAKSSDNRLRFSLSSHEVIAVECTSK